MERFAVRVEKEAFNFASGHFLIFADGSREELHGHNYRVSVELEGELDPAHIVLDFRNFKLIVKNLSDTLDHRMLLPAENPLLKIERQIDAWTVRFGSDQMAFPHKDVVLLPIANTSAELLARYFCERIRDQIRVRHPEARLKRIEVGIEEGPGQIAFCRQEL